jgi:hypothetical protein
VLARETCASLAFLLCHWLSHYRYQYSLRNGYFKIHTDHRPRLKSAGYITLGDISTLSERAIAALETQRNIEDAARTVGISVKTLSREFIGPIATDISS